MSSQIAQFLLTLSEVHKDGLDLHHFAEKRGSSKRRSTMPVTAYVYEFFIYNTLYSIDWNLTQAKEEISYYSDKKEGYKQQEFENFLRKLAEDNPSILKKNFMLLKEIPEDAFWIKVIPDSNITLESGEDFFLRLNQLIDLIKVTEPKLRANMGSIFDRIQRCRKYIYYVRNNIFHGTKTLGKIGKPNQQKRIYKYHEFLKCLVSCFFDYAETVPEFSFD